MAVRVNILAFDASSSVCSVALFVDGQFYVDDRAMNENRRHTDHLLSNIETLLSQSASSLHDLTYLAVGAGPGSFTGVRLACSAAEMLSFALSIPVLSISSLQAAAQTMWNTHHQTECHVIVDARMKRFYLGHYRFDEARQIMLPISDDCIVDAGSGDWSETQILPKAQALIELALDRINRGEVKANERVKPNYVLGKEMLFGK